MRQVLTNVCVVDLKYITGKQIIEFVYEGRPRAVWSTGLLPAKNPGDALVDALDSLSLTPTRIQLWTIGWDCTVVIAAENKIAEPQKV